MKRLLRGIPWQNRTANRILGGFRYIHLTKGTFILNFDSALPFFESLNFCGRGCLLGRQCGRGNGLVYDIVNAIFDEVIIVGLLAICEKKHGYGCIGRGESKIG